MPITAKLSQRFYAVFGDDVVNELVDLLNLVDANSRSQLREFNELNFARSDAKHEQRTAKLEAKMDQRFGELGAEFDRRFLELEARFEHRFIAFEQRLVGLEAKLDQSIAGLEAKLDQRLVEFESRIEAKLERSLKDSHTSLIRWMFVVGVTTSVSLAGLMLALFHQLR